MICIDKKIDKKKSENFGTKGDKEWLQSQKVISFELYVGIQNTVVE